MRGIAHLGGTILGTVNKGHPFEFITERDGKKVTVDVSDDIMRRFREVGGDAAHRDRRRRRLPHRHAAS